MKNIVWLASYPKSGNTWFRIFLSNLLHPETEIDINAIKTDGIASSRELFNASTHIESSDLTIDEIDNLRPDVYKNLSDSSQNVQYIKAHDAFTRTPNGKQYLFPADASLAALYFVRNPLDVAVSYAHHSVKNYDDIIIDLSDSEHAMCNSRNRLTNQLRQKLFTWSDHVESWINQSEIPVLMLRYEDMKEKPLETFRKAANFIGFKRNDEDILCALKRSSFDILKQQEENTGFREKFQRSERFFRKGQIGDYRIELSAEQIEKIVKEHKTVMMELGYMATNGDLVY